MANVSINRSKQSHTINWQSVHHKLSNMAVPELARVVLEKNQPVGRELDLNVLLSMREGHLVALIASLEREAARKNGTNKENPIS